MSKHISRKERWVRRGPTRSSSDLGEVIYQRNAWYVVVAFRTPEPQSQSEVRSSASTTLRLGPFKRPRNAMVALEREATALRNQYKADIIIRAPD